jgi:hypothetical protein
MRLTGLLAILLFLAIVFFAAPAASYGQTADSVASSATISPEISKREMSPRLTRRTFSEERRDGVCYTMRTYIVARESRDSDVTVPKSYQECLPEWKLQMRTTEQKLIDSSSR